MERTTITEEPATMLTTDRFNRYLSAASAHRALGERFGFDAFRTVVPAPNVQKVAAFYAARRTAESTARTVPLVGDDRHTCCGARALLGHDAECSEASNAPVPLADAVSAETFRDVHGYDRDAEADEDAQRRQWARDDAEHDAEAASEAAYFDRLERRDEIMGFHDDEPPDPGDPADREDALKVTMRTIIISALAILALVVIGAAPAAAHWAPPPLTPEGRLAYFLPVARAAWPNSPCAGRETVHLHANIDTMDYSSYGYGSYDPAAYALIDSCTVEISDRAPADAINWCSELVHEFGHLALGPDHSDDPASIMFGGHLNVWEPCVIAASPPRPAPTAKNYVREMLPAPATSWRVTCTPMHDAHPRCRATRRSAHARRFTILVVRGEIVSAQPKDER
jgi:hypothetical protein